MGDTHCPYIHPHARTHTQYFLDWGPSRGRIPPLVVVLVVYESGPRVWVEPLLKTGVVRVASAFYECPDSGGQLGRYPLPFTPHRQRPPPDRVVPKHGKLMSSESWSTHRRHVLSRRQPTSSCQVRGRNGVVRVRILSPGHRYGTVRSTYRALRTTESRITEGKVGTTHRGSVGRDGRTGPARYFAGEGRQTLSVTPRHSRQRTLFDLQ